MVKFARNGKGNDVFDDATYGPTFGGGNNLIFFSNSYTKSGAYCNTYGSSNFGNTYNTNGYSAKTFNGNSNAYLDIEVYAREIQEMNYMGKINHGAKVTLLTGAVRDSLLDRLLSFSTPSPTKVPAARLLLVGSVVAGKSSFFNTVSSVFKGEIRSQAATGTTPHSLTTKYRVYAIRGGHQTPAFRLCDTMGLEEDQGLDVVDMAYLLGGHVPDHFQFNSAVRITRESAGFVKDPGLADVIHCVALVIDGSTYKVMSSKVKEKLLGVQTLARDRDIPVHVVLTEVDKVCQDVAEDPSLIFRSRAIENKVKDISDAFGIQSNHVQPVKNYESETSIDPRVDILTLNALRQMTVSAEDYIEDRLDDKEVETDTKISKMNISS
ncbi:interferon-induced protein 44-like [Lingula anatina]|uniref:Interferon-induced protein 44-like n=1 Tax=Lingula anatina TaxID=7574 RepID=A0A1S3JKC0_LINAN|nr:interferon-induced protein 44-like [Lingula anatina]|eukprot:XP_013410359.1 interferon-induced protein 44-like [Lingula anatina]